MKQADKKTKLIDLFLAFAKVGVMTFGGGYAMIPILQREVAEKKKWVSDEELMDYYAIGQCTPGIIAVNTATFVGYKVRGVLGAIFATLGIVFPSLVIIIIISAILTQIADLEIVQNAFAAIRCCVLVLIINSVIKLSKSAIKDRFALIICVVAFLLSTILSLSPIIMVVLCAAAGILIKNSKEIKK